MNIQTEKRNKFSRDPLYHLEILETDVYRLRYDHNQNPLLYRTFDSLLTNISLIEKLIKSSPRFEWQIIQFEMDRLYRLESSITGYEILFDFKKAKLPNREFILFQKFDNPKTIKL